MVMDPCFPLSLRERVRVRVPTESHMQSDMARVMVVGCSGSGKTTLARQLAQVLGASHIELDALYWLPHWIPRPTDEFRALVAMAVSQEHWVTDGNYSAVRDLVWSRATAIIWLNYPFPTVFRQVLRRTLRRTLTHEELFAGNHESWRRSFLSRDSILWWVITTFRRRRRQYRALFDQPAAVAYTRVEFRRPSEARRFLVALGAAVGD